MQVRFNKCMMISYTQISNANKEIKLALPPQLTHQQSDCTSNPPFQTTYALRGGSGGGHSPNRRGVWGSEPPDPGSVLTFNNRNPQVFIIYRSAYYRGTANP